MLLFYPGRDPSERSTSYDANEVLGDMLEEEKRDKSDSNRKRPRSIRSQERDDEEKRRKENVQKLLDMPTIEEELEREKISPSCSSYCLSDCPSHITSTDIFTERVALHSLKQGNESREYVILTMRHNSRKIGGKWYHSLDQNDICSGFYHKVVLKIGTSKYRECFRMYKNGQLRLEKTSKSRLGDRGSIALAFMRDFIHYHGDCNPASNKTILPRGVCLRDLYKQYKEQEKEHPVMENSFTKLWRKYFNKKISFNSLGNIVKCNICTAYKKILPTITNPQARADVKGEYHLHLDKQR